MRKEVEEAVQPLFSALLSSLLLGTTYSYRTVLSLLVVVGGVALSAFKEPQFHIIGADAVIVGREPFDCEQS